MDAFKSSRFRFLDSQPFSHVCKYTDIALPSSNVDQVVVRTNGIFFALPITGPTGQLYVRPVIGEERYTHKSVRLNCHKYAVSAFTFDPFDTSMMMTGADDGEIKLWKIPNEGIVKDGSEPVLSLDGHRRKILNMEYNPVAADVFASGSSDGSCRIWSVSNKREIISMDIQGAQLQEMKWDFTGSLLCTGTKNREYQIWDTRTVNAVVSWIGHASPRRSYMSWLGDSYYLVTTGYDKRSNREILLRDIRNIENVVYSITADNSPGPFVPFYNPVCHVLWYSGRGDAKMMGIDVDDVSMWNNREGGNSISINLKSSTKSIAMFPHYLLDTKKNEVDKFVKINMESGVDGFEVVLPHHAGAAITEIYGTIPQPIAACSCADWIRGEITTPMGTPVTTTKQTEGIRHSGAKTVMTVQGEQKLSFMKPADMHRFITDWRVKNIPDKELLQIQNDLEGVAQSLMVVQKNYSAMGTLSRTVNVNMHRKNVSIGSHTDVETMNDGVRRRTSICCVPEDTRKATSDGSNQPLLEKSRTRLCLNRNGNRSSTSSSKLSIPRPPQVPPTPSVQQRPASPSVKPVGSSLSAETPSIPKSLPNRGVRVSDVYRAGSPTKTIETPKMREPIKPVEPPPIIEPPKLRDSTRVQTVGEVKRSSVGKISGETTLLPPISERSSNESSKTRTSVLVSQRSSGVSLPSTISLESRMDMKNSAADVHAVMQRLDGIELKLKRIDQISSQLDDLTKTVNALAARNNSEDMRVIKDSLSAIRSRLQI